MATEKKKGVARPAPAPPVAAETATEEKVAPEVKSGQTEILIERRIEVAKIQVSENGAENAITLAFQTSAEYIVNKMDDDEGLEVEFEFDGRTFYAGVMEKKEGNA